MNIHSRHPRRRSLPCATPAPRRQRGFSLVEMIAAFLVFAIAMGVLMQVLSSSLRNARVSTTYTYAALWAQSKLDTLGVAEPVEPGQTSGAFNDEYHWELFIDEVDAHEIEPPAQMNVSDALDDATQLAAGQQMPDQGMGISPVELYEARLVVRWGGDGAGNERSAEFITLRAANPDVGGLGMPANMRMPPAQQAQRAQNQRQQPQRQQMQRQQPQRGGTGR